MKALIVRNKDERAYLHFYLIPDKNDKGGYWSNFNGCLVYIDDSSIPNGINPQWEDNKPIEVNVTIIPHTNNNENDNKLKVWATRNPNGKTELHFHTKPIKIIDNIDYDEWFSTSGCVTIKDNILPKDINPQWTDNEPIQVQLKIEII